MRVLLTALAISTVSFLTGVAGDLAVSSQASTQPAQAAVARVALPPASTAYAPLPEVAPQRIETVELKPLVAPALFVEPLREEFAVALEPAALVKPVGRGAILLSKL